MKTPEQIADEVIETKAGGKYPDDFKFERALIVAAIEADRAQRRKVLARLSALV